jgi:tRNA A-37 threonylcarbamoyl transferase component Bud32
MGNQQIHHSSHKNQPPKGFAQATATMSQARSSLAAASSGELVFFGGGLTATGASDRVDMYNVTNGSWTTATLSVPRYELAATSTGNLVFFGGGRDESTVFDRVDIFTTSTGSWSTATLSQPRFDLASTSVGDLVLFAGGQSLRGVYSSVVDVYNVTRDTWTTATLSQARSGIAANSVANRYALFAGGFVRSKFLNDIKISNVVDIFDATSGKWSTATLSQPRRYVAATSLSYSAFFGGGQTSENQPSNVVDVFNAKTQTWSTASLSQARYCLAAAAVGEVVTFGGGTPDGFTASATVDMFFTFHDSRCTINLARPCFNLVATSSMDKILFGGGIGLENTPLNSVDILNVPLVVDNRPNFEISFRSLKLEEEIGRGAFGIVYKGRYKKSTVAIKKFYVRDEFCQKHQKSVDKEFQRILQILSKLNHPKVAKYFGGCSILPNLCTVTEYYIEGSLYDLLHVKKVKLSIKQQLEYALAIAEGMEYLHAQKPMVLHYNLKSSNIMLNNNIPKIIDCHISQTKVSLVSKHDNHHIAVENWMAPEVLKENGKYTEKSDVWSYGMILYELVTNRIPYSHCKTKSQIFKAIVLKKKKPSFPKETEISPTLHQLMEECWNWLSERRPSFLHILQTLKIAVE